MGHRLNLLKVLHRDLFIVKHNSSDLPVTAVGNNGTDVSASAMSVTRHLAVEIFEVPKGVRLFPLILRFLFPVSYWFLPIFCIYFLFYEMYIYFHAFLREM